VPQVDSDPDILQSFLGDAAHVPGGFAAGVAFPRDEGEVAALVAGAARVLAIGAQSSLTGGATPRGELLLSTRGLSGISPIDNRTVRVGAGVPLETLQRALAAEGLYYPPAPTFRGASLGGTVATNAAGAATFKYGSTRSWVRGLTVVLADGDVLDIRRGDVSSSKDGTFEIARPSGHITRVPVPRYVMPEVAKLSAGYFARPDMDLVDLFIGSEGTLGVIVDVVLRVIDRPRLAVALVTCASDAHAVRVAGLLREEAQLTWRGSGVLDVAAIEYIGCRSLGLLDDMAFARAGVPRPPSEAAQLFVQIEMGASQDAALIRFEELLDAADTRGDPVMALSGDEAGAERLFELREAVPAQVNAAIAYAQATSDPDIQKTAGDMIVPFERVADSLALYRSACESRGLLYAIWGHLSDGNLHPNVIPRSRRDVGSGREAILEMARGVMSMGGAPSGRARSWGEAPSSRRCCASSMATGASSQCARSRGLSIPSLEARAGSAASQRGDYGTGDGGRDGN
jgi:D-lactate dehydrogenase (cytochrome)